MKRILNVRYQIVFRTWIQYVVGLARLFNLIVFEDENNRFSVETARIHSFIAYLHALLTWFFIRSTLISYTSWAFIKPAFIRRYFSNFSIYAYFQWKMVIRHWRGEGVKFGLALLRPVRIYILKCHQFWNLAPLKMCGIFNCHLEISLHLKKE